VVHPQHTPAGRQQVEAIIAADLHGLPAGEIFMAVGIDIRADLVVAREAGGALTLIV
jgi:hypothetical protein